MIPSPSNAPVAVCSARVSGDVNTTWGMGLNLSCARPFPPPLPSSPPPPSSSSLYTEPSALARSERPSSATCLTPSALRGASKSMGSTPVCSYAALKVD